MICVSREVLGTEADLLQCEQFGKVAWVSSPPRDAWTFGFTSKTSRSIEELAFGVLLHLPNWPHNRNLSKPFEQINFKGIIKWHFVMTKQQYCDELKQLLSSLWKIVQHSRSQNYIPHLLASQEIIDDLENLHVDIDVLTNLMHHDSQADVIRTMQPIDVNITKVVRYNRQTSTGRVKHTSDSPQVLRLKRENRRCLVSRYPGGRLVQIDYSSVEPRLLCHIVGVNAGHDVYSYVADELLQGRLTRDMAKVVVMGILYGIGHDKLTSILPKDLNPAQLIKQVRRGFKIEELEARLQSVFRETGCVITEFGRFLKPKRTDPSGLLSYYIQGSAVDLCLSGFSRINSYIKEKALEIVPLFVIHDGLFLDISPAVNDASLQIAVNEGVLFSAIGGRFPIAIKSLY